jgi:hypothetical protein
MNLDLRNSHNRPFKAVIDGTPCKGRVSVDKSKDVFLCQNEKSGVLTSNRFTYKYSWIVQHYNEKYAFLNTNVTDFQFITEEELNADAPPPPSLDGKEIEVKIDGVSYTATLKTKIMTTIYTTQRCLTVEEDYETISHALDDEKYNLLELTEVITTHYEFPESKTSVSKRKVLIQKRHIVEVSS